MKKKLLIFGSSGALGLGVSDVLVKKPYEKVYLFDKKINKTDFDKNKVIKIPVKDLTAEENVIEAFGNIEPAEDTLFFLFSTIGGFAGGKTIWQTELDDWKKIFEMNLKTNFLIAKHFAKLVEKSGGGSICFTAAYTGLEAEGNKGSYGISKSSLIHLVKTLALEGNGIKLSVNAIAPYIIDTPANREWMKEGDYSNWMKPVEIGELLNSIFDNFHFITGNIISLKHRFELT